MGKRSRVVFVRNRTFDCHLPCRPVPCSTRIISSAPKTRGSSMRAGSPHESQNRHPVQLTESASPYAVAHRSTTLQGWKEVAAELKRAVRTVQRWEHDLGLPVRRVGRGRRSPVLAFKYELESW